MKKVAVQMWGDVERVFRCSECGSLVGSCRALVICAPGVDFFAVCVWIGFEKAKQHWLSSQPLGKSRARFSFFSLRTPYRPSFDLWKAGLEKSMRS